MFFKLSLTVPAKAQVPYRKTLCNKGEACHTVRIPALRDPSHGMTIETGTFPGPYEIRSRLGAGGMGEVPMLAAVTLRHRK